MTVKELIEMLKTCDEKSEVKVEHWNSTVSPIEEVIDYSKELNEVTYPDGYKSWEGLGFVLQWAKYGLKK